jgi:choline transport protein
MIALNVPGYAVPAWHGVLLTVGAVLLTIIFNTVLLRRLPTFEGGMLAIHVFAFIAVFTVLWVMGDRAPAREVFTEWSDPQGWGSVSVFGISRMVYLLICAGAVWCGNICWIVVSHWLPSW